MVITREFLAQYVYLETEIKRLKRRLKYYEDHPLASTHGVVSGSNASFPYQECHFVISGADIKSEEERNKKISQLIIDIAGNIQLYNDMKMDIENFIEHTKFDTLDEKSIMALKYIEGMTDYEIGMELGYERSWISRKIDRIIDKYQ